jgi:hypothetical protein
MSVANELSSDIAAALLRGNNPENAEALLKAALLAHSVLQNLSAGERPGRRGKRDEESAVPRNSAASAAS